MSVRTPHGSDICRHLTWPPDSRPAVWSVSADAEVTPGDRTRMVTAAALAARDRGLWLDPSTAHRCKTRYGRAYWLAVARPPLSERRKKGAPRWRLFIDRLMRLLVTPSAGPIHRRTGRR